VSEDQLFHLMSRGLTEDEMMATIVRGILEPIARRLPMEYALELNRLIELQMGGRSADVGPARGRLCRITQRGISRTDAAEVASLPRR
jgi:hypothetical protein